MFSIDSRGLEHGRRNIWREIAGIGSSVTEILSDGDTYGREAYLLGKVDKCR